jgi:hypothetical protein
MKLYEVPNNTKIRVLGDIKTPPSSKPINAEEILFFSHVDGMYSHCIDSKGKTVYLVVWAEVEIVG